MKYFLLGLIKIYQMIQGPWHNTCKYTPTCSNYAIDAIIEYGSIKGSILSFKRIIRCNPYSKGGYDPVRKKDKK